MRGNAAEEWGVWQVNRFTGETWSERAWFFGWAGGVEKALNFTVIVFGRAAVGAAGKTGVDDAVTSGTGKGGFD